MRKLFLSILFVSLVFTGCEKKELASDMISVKGVTTEVALNTNSGKTIKATRSNDGFTFSGYEGKAVLLGFFATWCPPCKAEIPHLIALNDKYKDKFAVIAVLVEKDKPKAELDAFIAENKIDYEVAVSPSNESMINAVGGIRGIPNMFLFTSDGRLIAHYPGAVPQEMIEDDLKKAGITK